MTFVKAFLATVLLCMGASNANAMIVTIDITASENIFTFPPRTLPVDPFIASFTVDLGVPFSNDFTDNAPVLAAELNFPFDGPIHYHFFVDGEFDELRIGGLVNGLASQSFLDRDFELLLFDVRSDAPRANSLLVSIGNPQEGIFSYSVTELTVTPSAVPLPSALVLMVSALGMMGGVRLLRAKR